MRRLTVSLLFALCLAFLYSCKSDGKTTGLSQSSEQFILGKWSLQQEKVVQHIDAAVSVDTTCSTNPNAVALVQFNLNGTYYSKSLFTSAGSENLSSTVFAEDSTAGVFSFAGTNFSVSAPISGLWNSGSTLTTTTPFTTIATISNYSSSATITQLTANNLNLHTEVIYTFNNDNQSHVYKTDCDYYYTK